MKKILLTLLITLFLCPIVNADELPKAPIDGMGFANSCSKNLYDPTFGVAYFQSGTFRSLTGITGTTYPVPNNIIPVKPNTTYFYSSSFSTYGGIIELNSNVQLVKQYQQWNNTTITTSSDTYYLSFWYYTTADSASGYWYQLEEGASKTSYVPYELCSTEPVEPEIPEEPEIELEVPPLTLSNKIYVPDLNYACYVVQSEGVIRAYETTPQKNSTINYRDYYINSNYIFRDSSQTYSSNSSLPTCLANDTITDDPYYRVDLDRILVIFTIMCIFCLWIPLKVFMRLFRRFN